MPSSKPYFIRAVYEWLVDSELTPYLMVDATSDMVQIPKQFVEDGQIVLNIAPQAVKDLTLGNTIIQFDTRFSGVSHNLRIPVIAVEAIYAHENGRGMAFNEKDMDDDDGREGDDDGGDGDDDDTPPTLTIVK